MTPLKPKRAKPMRALFKPLRRAIPVPVWADATIRLAIAFGLIGIVILIHWSDRDGLIDSYDGQVSFLDVVYFTMISITTTGFGDIAPVSDNARLVEALIVTPIRLAVIYIFVGTAYNFIIKNSWEKWRMARIQERLQDHIVVLGYGVSGSNAVIELKERGTNPHDIVVVDPSGERLKEAEEQGCNVLEGDASQPETLEAVRVGHARTVLVSAGRDDTTILIALAVRAVSSEVSITAVIRADRSGSAARQAGVNNVINPVRFTGLLLAGSAEGKHIPSYLDDLATASGRVQLIERMVEPGEIGKSLDNLVTAGRGLRIYRGEKAIGFWEDAAQFLEAGDLIVEIQPCSPSQPDSV